MRHTGQILPGQTNKAQPSLNGKVDDAVQCMFIPFDHLSETYFNLKTITRILNHQSSEK